MSVGWEYRVDKVGGVLRHVKTEQLADLLNEAAGEAWEPVQVIPLENTNQLLVVLRRPAETRRRSRVGTWDET
jgi:hypothetical protein